MHESWDDPNRSVSWVQLDDAPLPTALVAAKRPGSPDGLGQSAAGNDQRDLLRPDGSLATFGYPTRPTYRPPVHAEPQAVERLLPGGLAIGRHYGEGIVAQQQAWPNREQDEQWDRLGSVPVDGKQQLPADFFA